MSQIAFEFLATTPLLKFPLGVALPEGARREHLIEDGVSLCGKWKYGGRVGALEDFTHGKHCTVCWRSYAKRITVVV